MQIEPGRNFTKFTSPGHHPGFRGIGEIPARHHLRLFPGGRLPRCIKTAQSATVLAFPASVRIAGSAYLPFLQRQSSCAVARVTLPRTFAVGTSSVGFRHDLNPPYVLLLALGAEKSAAIPLPDPLNGIPATQTGFAFPPKHFQVILIPSGLAFKVNKI